MAKQEKRARKKDHRDQVMAQRRAAMMRRRVVRSVVAGAALLIIVVLALTSGNDSDKKDPTSAQATPTPTASVPVAGLEVACGAEAPPTADPKQYKKPPKMTLDTGADYRAVIHTSCGDIEIDLLEDKAPVTVNNFIFLAEEGFYDGTTWHRIERNFVIQGGDPDGQNGSELDGPGYAIKDELPEKSNEYIFGAFAMANSGPNTSGSQFFIITHKGSKKGAKALKEPAGLQPLYSIFGQVVERSFAVVDQIAKLETVGGTDPIEAVKPIATVYVESIEIIKR